MEPRKIGHVKNERRQSENIKEARREAILSRAPPRARAKSITTKLILQWYPNDIKYDGRCRIGLRFPGAAKRGNPAMAAISPGLSEKETHNNMLWFQTWQPGNLRQCHRCTQRNTGSSHRTLLNWRTRQRNIEYSNYRCQCKKYKSKCQCQSRISTIAAPWTKTPPIFRPV
jgi:hypothetical protein